MGKYKTHNEVKKEKVKAALTRALYYAMTQDELDLINELLVEGIYTSEEYGNKVAQIEELELKVEELEEEISNLKMGKTKKL